MLLVDTYLAPSQIHGIGLFTREFIPEGKLIWTFNSTFDRCITNESKILLPEHIQTYIEVHGFRDLTTGLWILDGGNDLHVNHSDSYNVEERGEIIGGVTRNLYANRDIRADEELTQNYLEFDEVAKFKLSYNQKE